MYLVAVIAIIWTLAAVAVAVVVGPMIHVGQFRDRRRPPSSVCATEDSPADNLVDVT